MARLRFNTDLDLFAAFPKASAHVRIEPTGAPSLTVLRDLATRGKLEEAISFCAYLLPRREAVAWACRALRSLEKSGREPGPAPLRAAEAWVEQPADEGRTHAYAAWTSAAKDDPAAWVALATARSGGKALPTGLSTMPSSPQLTPAAVRVALLLALHRLPAAQKAPAVQGWIAEGLRLAQAGL